MKIRTEITLSGTIAGIFGWLWLLSGPVATYFLASKLFMMALGRLFLALATSIIAKWLAKGFDDNRVRIQYEDQLIQQGLTAEDAAKKWVQEYLKNNCDNVWRHTSKHQALEQLATLPQIGTNNALTHLRSYHADLSSHLCSRIFHFAWYQNVVDDGGNKA